MPTLQLEPVGTAMIFYGLVLFMFSWQLFGKADAKGSSAHRALYGFISVSYTHLTLPTKRIV